MASLLAMRHAGRQSLSGPSAFARTSQQFQLHYTPRWNVTTTSKPRPFALRSQLQPVRQITSRLSPTVSGSERRASAAVAPAQKAGPGVPAPYSPPTTGLLSYLPSSWVPYAELIRLDKPVGTNYLFFPCMFSTILAAPLTSPITPIFTVVGTCLLFYSGAIIMRGAGCTVNDLWDRNLMSQEHGYDPSQEAPSLLIRQSRSWAHSYSLAWLFCCNSHGNASSTPPRRWFSWPSTHWLSA
jgi:hypothetical protein